MKAEIRFRLLALSQVSYESARYAHDAIKRRLGLAPEKSVIVNVPDGTPFRELQVTQGLSSSDLLLSCKKLWNNSIARGHVNPYLFCGVICDSYPELEDRTVVADNRQLLRIAMRHAAGIVKMGARRSAYLPAFVDAQMAHLSGCQGCIDAVLARIRAGLRTRSGIRAMLEHAGLRRPASPPV